MISLGRDFADKLPPGMTSFGFLCIIGLFFQRLVYAQQTDGEDSFLMGVVPQQCSSAEIASHSCPGVTYSHDNRITSMFAFPRSVLCHSGNSRWISVPLSYIPPSIDSLTQLKSLFVFSCTAFCALLFIGCVFSAS